MSSATVLFVLNQELKIAHEVGTYGLLIALGPGFSTEMVLIQWEEETSVKRVKEVRKEWRSIWFWGMVFFVICQRIAELRASINAKWIRKQGGYEVGQKHYPLLLGIHTSFFL